MREKVFEKESVGFDFLYNSCLKNFSFKEELRWYTIHVRRYSYKVPVYHV